MKLICFISILLSSGSCQKMKIHDTPLSCIKKYIDSNKNNKDWPVSSVDEYEFQGKLVYAISPPKNYADATVLGLGEVRVFEIRLPTTDAN